MDFLQIQLKLASCYLKIQTRRCSLFLKVSRFILIDLKCYLRLGKTEHAIKTTDLLPVIVLMSFNYYRMGHLACGIDIPQCNAH